MKKVFFLSMMLVMCFISNAFAFDESKWDLEERIYLGEFSLGKAELTNVMSHGILRLGGLPDGRFVRISVRTNRVGNIGLNTQLVEKREQTIINALRRIIPESKLPKANVEIFAGRYDQDGVDAQGAWIEVYKPRQTVYVPWAKLSPHKVTMEDYKKTVDDGMFTMTTVFSLVAIGCLMLLCGFFVSVARNKKKIMAAKQLGVIESIKSDLTTPMQSITPVEPVVTEPVVLEINQDRLNEIPRISRRKCNKRLTKGEVTASFTINGYEIWCFGQKKTDGTILTFHVGPDGTYLAKNTKRWKKSVESTVRQWLLSKDGDALNPTDFSLIRHAMNQRNFVIAS